MTFELEAVGVFLSIMGVILGLGGAWYTAQKTQKQRRFGFLLWLINSPMIVLSLFGIAQGWWTGLGAYILVVLNMMYFYTAYVGYASNELNKEPIEGEYQGA